ncbi:hypothetical protein HCG51_25300 [Tolypothrix sp. PCC 7910]|uniref:hypothetical protein n=1 Tax=Tolypothrix sp. PCC 7910 TaxID=2099387 RepID=UPI0014278C5B|nr:hypothetical protein [Tolypothrix sp. PCC 7910]QIR35283.1 hypothetical protein HCG51_25300 [Tolypothrix sp. PCC 7910]
MSDGFVLGDSDVLSMGIDKNFAKTTTSTVKEVKQGIGCLRWLRFGNHGNERLGSGWSASVECEAAAVTDEYDASF